MEINTNHMKTNTRTQFPTARKRNVHAWRFVHAQTPCLFVSRRFPRKLQCTCQQGASTCLQSNDHHGNAAGITERMVDCGSSALKPVIRQLLTSARLDQAIPARKTKRADHEAELDAGMPTCPRDPRSVRARSLLRRQSI
jgi:hypothetical protein